MAEHCSECRRDFGGYRTFLDHRRGGRCLHAAELRREGMKLGDDAIWHRTMTVQPRLPGVLPTGRPRRSVRDEAAPNTGGGA